MSNYRIAYSLKTFERRFWSRVKKTNSCWIWTGTKNGLGYGQLHRGGRSVQAHRAAWEITHGRPVPDGLCVCHNCPDGDNRLCCNPEHMFLGTKTENNADRNRKGRQVQGERHLSAKLTPEKIREATRLRSEGLTFVQLGERYGVAATNISRAVQGKSWKSVRVRDALKKAMGR
jgi:hypothetical protein